MKTKLTRFLAVALVSATAITHAADPLPSWNEGTAKKSIIAHLVYATC